MSRLRRLLDVLLAYAAIGALIAGAVMLTSPEERTELHGGIVAIDGDTLLIGAERVRLGGIDAPEMDQRCEAPTGSVACGRAARLALAALLAGDVSCSGSRRDKYDRLLVRCTDAKGDLAERLVEGGHAVAYGCCVAAEERARAARRGVWATRFERPEEWRRRHGAQAKGT